MIARTIRTPLILLQLVILAGCSDGNVDETDVGDPNGRPLTEDPRSMSEICATYCENARTHGCEGEVTIGAPTCAEGCDIAPPNDDNQCPVAWKNHTACLADVPNLCDADVRDDDCLDAYCTMRDRCELPDPQCR